MAQESPAPTSFSRRRRWGLFVSVIISIVAMVALIVMLNYLGARYYARMNWSAKTSMELSPQTLGLLKSITNEVKVVVYYDKKDRLYDSVAALLEEYRLANRKISVQYVDYTRDAAAAMQVKTAYKLGATDNKNLVIFDCNGKTEIVHGTWLEDRVYEQVPNDKEREYRDKLQAFKGEMWFSSTLLDVTNPKPLKACFLEGDGEHQSGSSEQFGYQKFKDLLQEKYIQSAVIDLLGTNTVPADCDLLIIAGPQHTMEPVVLEKIKQYLAQGGRLFVLFNYVTMDLNTGLEKVLAEWGINVGMNEIIDRQNTGSGGAVVVTNFNVSHPIMNPLPGSSIALVRPRSISRLNGEKSNPEAPKVEELAFTSDRAEIRDVNLSKVPKPAGREVSLMVAVEKSSPKGVFPERPTTRILAVGDSVFLCNFAIEALDNREFAGFAFNWLLGQRQFMQGIGPQPVKEWKLMMTQAQMNSVEWIFLAGMPGGILVLGGLVWLRRRH